VTSQTFGPTKKRRVSPVTGSAHSIWLLPKPAYAPVLTVLPETSVWIQSRPLGAT
jgi:hypothetical protein